MAGTVLPLVNPIYPGGGGGSADTVIVTPFEGTPKFSYTVSGLLVPGGTADLDSSQVTVAVSEARLVSIVYASSIAFEGTIHTVVDNVASAALLPVSSVFGETTTVSITSPQLVSLTPTVGVVFDGFRLSVENCDRNKSGTVSVTFFWDEIA